MSHPSRRQFIASSAVLAAGAASATSFAADASPGDSPQQYYEWRTYRVDTEPQQSRVLAYLESAALPAWQRMGVGPVGVFTEIGDTATPAVHVLLVFASAADSLQERARLEADAEYQAAASDYLAADKDDPAFAQIDSQLLLAFAGQPEIALPKHGSGVLELRTYHSHSEAKARRKIDMFNDGEIEVFHKVGFDTVLFGEALYGTGLPHLTYLLASEDLPSNKASWAAFIDHPEWKAMKDLPKYAQTVSKIEKLYLSPTSFSQV